MKQLASLVHPWMWGVLLGILFGVANIVSTIVAPLADDDPPAIIVMALSVLALWTLVGFAAERRRFRFADAVRGGMAAAS